MKRAFCILGVIGVTVLITYLAISKQRSQERAARLDRALMDAEARVIQLEADIEAVKQRITELDQGREASPASPKPRPPVPAVKLAVMLQPTPTTTLSRVTGGASLPVAAAQEVPAATPLAAGPLVRYAAFSKPGVTSLMRIEGTSTVHDWQVESHLIGGSAEISADLPTGPEFHALPATLEAKVNVFIPVRSLKSVARDGSPYSDAMDEIMYGKLLSEAYKRITYSLTSLTLKEQPSRMSEPFLYEATGNLAVAGVTNVLTMPMTVLLPDPAGRMRFVGSAKLKMSDFNIAPPSPSLAGVSIKTGDEVTLRFVWWVNRVSAGQALR